MSAVIKLSAFSEASNWFILSAPRGVRVEELGLYPASGRAPCCGHARPRCSCVRPVGVMLTEWPTNSVTTSPSTHRMTSLLVRSTMFGGRPGSRLAFVLTQLRVLQWIRSGSCAGMRLGEVE